MIKWSQYKTNQKKVAGLLIHFLTASNCLKLDFSCSHEETYNVTYSEQSSIGGTIYSLTASEQKDNNNKTQQRKIKKHSIL